MQVLFVLNVIGYLSNILAADDSIEDSGLGRTLSAPLGWDRT